MLLLQTVYVGIINRT